MSTNIIRGENDRPICVCTLDGQKCGACQAAAANRPTLHITQGLPASGKSTWARAWMSQDPNRVRICRDDLRRMIRGGWTGNRADEDLITAMVTAGIRAALLHSRDVVADATHIRPQDLERVIWIARQDKHLARVVLHRWDTRPGPCIQRDRQRPPGEHVGGDVIWDMYDTWRATMPGHTLLAASVDEVIIHE